MSILNRLLEKMSFNNYDYYKELTDVNNLEKNYNVEKILINKITLIFLNFKSTFYNIIKNYYYYKYVYSDKFKNNIIKTNINNTKLLENIEHNIEVIDSSSTFYINDNLFRPNSGFSTFSPNIDDFGPCEYISYNNLKLSIANNSLKGHLLNNGSFNKVSLFSRTIKVETPVVLLNSKKDIINFYKNIRINSNKRDISVHNDNSKLKHRLSFPSCGIIEIHGLNDLINEGLYINREYYIVFYNYENNETYIIKLMINKKDYIFFNYFSLLYNLNQTTRSSLLLFSTNSSRNKKIREIETFLNEYFGGFLIKEIESFNKNSDNTIKTWLYDYSAILEEFNKLLDE